MRIGLYVGQGGSTIDEIAARARAAADGRLSGVWTSEPAGFDALTTLALLGREIPEIGLGTSVVISYARHPIALATQALTVQGASGNRLTLGIGVSHEHIVSGQFGHSYDRPARHLREYLTALRPLLRGEAVDYQGDTLRAAGQISVPGTTPPPILIAALGPAMLRVAGELAEGTIALWVGPRAIEQHIVPSLAAASGGQARRVLVTLPVAVTADPEALRAEVARTYSRATTLPAYRGILDRGGLAGPADSAIIGDESEVERRLRELASAGATEFIAFPLGSTEEQARTTTLLAELAKR